MIWTAEPPVFEIAVPPKHGRVEYDAEAGHYVYTPDEGFTGVDEIVIEIRHEGWTSYSSTSRISVAPEFPWRNPDLSWDVNDDDQVNIADLLGVVQHLRTNGFASRLPEQVMEVQPALVDVNGDGAASLADLLDVVRELRERQTSAAVDALAADLRQSPLAVSP
jgi:hypothetical protein